VPCFERFLAKLDENGIIAADNMLEPEVVRPYAEAYRAAVRAVTSLQSVLLPIGHGVELSCVWRAAPAIGGL
jgi:predicted O-methyltransferase YrrM